MVRVAFTRLVNDGISAVEADPLAVCFNSNRNGAYLKRQGQCVWIVYRDLIEVLDLSPARQV